VTPDGEAVAAAPLMVLVSATGVTCVCCCAESFWRYSRTFVLGNKKSTILYRQQLASWDTKKAIRTCLCMTGFAIDGMGVSMDDGLVGEGGRARRSSVSERELVGETNE